MKITKGAKEGFVGFFIILCFIIHLCEQQVRLADVNTRADDIKFWFYAKSVANELSVL